MLIGIGIPSAEKFEAFPLGSTALLLQWKPPFDFDKEFSGYNIYYKDVNIVNEKKWKQINNSKATQTKLSGLKPNTKYHLSIYIITDVGERKRLIMWLCHCLYETIFISFSKKFWYIPVLIIQFKIKISAMNLKLKHKPSTTQNLIHLRSHGCGCLWIIVSEESKWIGDQIFMAIREQIFMWNIKLMANCIGSAHNLLSTKILFSLTNYQSMQRMRWSLYQLMAI